MSPHPFLIGLARRSGTSCHSRGDLGSTAGWGSWKVGGKILGKMFEVLKKTSKKMQNQHSFWTTTDEFLDDNVLEALAAEDDEDALLVLQFEDSIAETVQADSELSAFFSSYQDARKRLSEKTRFRGFWGVSRKGDGKGFGKKGKSSKGKGKGGLERRIANSYCRICWKKGHWKNECPMKPSSNSGSSTSSTTPSSIPTKTPTQSTHKMGPQVV